MQWWLTGEVTWWAPRPLALAFVPALAVFTFAICALLATQAPPPGQDDAVLVLPALVGMGCLFVAVQLLHLWLVAKTVRRNGR